ncbi:MAG: isochorismatase family protein [Pseudomonadota bacterium]
MIVWSAGFAAAAVLLWLGQGIWRIGRVSRGAPIPARAGTALLMIDLQTVFWDDGPYDADLKARVEATVRGCVAEARAAGFPVIALRQEWSLPATRVIARLFMKGQALAGSQGTGLAAPFRDLADQELVKRVQDGFETGALDALLSQLDVGWVRIMGLDGEYCVARTAEAALRRGFAVELCVDAIATARQAKQAEVVERLTRLGATLRRAPSRD